MGMNIKEGAALIGMVALLTVPWFVAGLNIWGWLFVGVSALVGIFEGYSSLKNGKTISQLFWKYRDANPTKSKIVLGVVSLGWVILMYHLLG